MFDLKTGQNHSTEYLDVVDLQPDDRRSRDYLEKWVLYSSLGNKVLLDLTKLYPGLVMWRKSIVPTLLPDRITANRWLCRREGKHSHFGKRFYDSHEYSVCICLGYKLEALAGIEIPDCKTVLYDGTVTWKF